MNRKIRLYLDTSVISMIDAPHTIKVEAITKKFFQIVGERKDRFQVYSSPMVDAEIEKAPNKKRKEFITLLESLDCIEISESEEVENLISAYLKTGFLTVKHVNDITHIAYAVVAQCDYIVSWNMKHIVREKTISGVQEINRHKNYFTPAIVTPILFMEDETK